MIVSMAIDLDPYKWLCKLICCLFILHFALKAWFDSTQGTPLPPWSVRCQGRVHP